MEIKGSRRHPSTSRPFFPFLKAPAALWTTSLDRVWLSLPLGEMKILGEIPLNLKDANAILGDRPFTFY